MAKKNRKPKPADRRQEDVDLLLEGGWRQEDIDGLDDETFEIAVATYRRADDSDDSDDSDDKSSKAGRGGPAMGRSGSVKGEDQKLLDETHDDYGQEVPAGTI